MISDFIEDIMHRILKQWEPTEFDLKAYDDALKTIGATPLLDMSGNIEKYGSSSFIEWEGDPSQDSNNVRARLDKEDDGWLEITSSI